MEHTDDVDVNADSSNINDPSLPKGWKRKVVRRKNGKSTGKYVFYSPENEIFDSKVELLEYFEKKSLDFNIDDFQFCKTSTKKPGDSHLAKKKSATPKKSCPQKTDQSSFPSNCLRTRKRLVVKIPFPVPIKYRRFYPSSATVWHYIEDCATVQKHAKLKNKWETPCEKEINLKRLAALKDSIPTDFPADEKEMKLGESPYSKYARIHGNITKLKNCNSSTCSTDRNFREKLTGDFLPDSDVSKLKSAKHKENLKRRRTKRPSKKGKRILSLKSVTNLSSPQASEFETSGKRCLIHGSSLAAHSSSNMDLSSEQDEQLSTAQ